MTATLPTAEPTTVNAGDTVKWVKSLPAYPASEGWTLSYTLINSGAKITFNASALQDDYQVNVSAATSGGWTAGTYDWRAQVSRDGEVFTVGSGRISVAPSFGAATLDARSQVRRMLESVEAVLEGRASSAVQEYQIAGRSLKHIAIPDLLTLRDKLRADVAREDAAAAVAAGLSPRGRIQVRFGP